MVSLRLKCVELYLLYTYVLFLILSLCLVAGAKVCLKIESNQLTSINYHQSSKCFFAHLLTTPTESIVFAIKKIGVKTQKSLNFGPP